MHFREPVISAKPKFLALTHVLIYRYWCCHITILLAYNASVMFLLHVPFDFFFHANRQRNKQKIF